MSMENRPKDTAGWLLITAGILSLAILLMCGCSRRTLPPAVTSVSTGYVQSDTAAFIGTVTAFLESRGLATSSSDSLVDRRTQTVVLNDRGDTVRLTDTRYVYSSSVSDRELTRELFCKDSVIRLLRMQLASVRSDSVSVPYPVERELTRWERTKMDFGGMAIGALVVVVCVAVVWLVRACCK